MQQRFYSDTPNGQAVRILSKAYPRYIYEIDDGKGQAVSDRFLQIARTLEANGC